jgi:hypothetical protein
MEPYLTNPGKKLDWPSKDTLESERIQNRPPPWLTIGLGEYEKKTQGKKQNGGVLLNFLLLSISLISEK